MGKQMGHGSVRNHSRTEMTEDIYIFIRDVDGQNQVTIQSVVLYVYRK